MISGDDMGMFDEVMMKEVRQAINLIARAIEAKLKEKNT